MAEFPKTRRRDLLSLAGRVLLAKLRGADPLEALSDWLKEAARRCGSPNFVIDLVGRKILYVSGSALSRQVLAAPPSEQAFVAGTMKRKAMSFLAPHALTILDGQDWHSFRAFNEDVLQPGKPHDHLPLILARVEMAFDRPVVDVEDVRRRMGQVMLAVVFGKGNAPETLIGDIQELFAEVGLRTALKGSWKGAKLKRFRSEVRRLWNGDAGKAEPCLLSLAHRAASRLAPEFQNEAMLLDQIPHWMFTFTNSGSDLLTRSVALIVSRSDCLARVRDEITMSQPYGDYRKFDDLRYLEACIMETGRLFPPVGQTVHRAAREHVFEGMEIDAGMEILQYFPFGNRDVSLDPLANNFRPERWLDPDDPIHTRELNVFLSGPRACPGRNIILFVLKSAIAHLLRDGGMEPKPSLLSSDPLPFSFANRFLRF